jgi:hypothetical protein
MSHIEELKAVIRKLHGAEPTHRESVPIKEVWNGQTIWEGVVEVFHLHGHPKTDTAYAWSHDIHPALSPLAAVRAAIVEEFRNAQPA